MLLLLLSRDGREEWGEGVDNAVDCYCLGMDEKIERKVWAMLLTLLSRDGREEWAEGLGNAVDCYCLGMDEKNER